MLIFLLMTFIAADILATSMLLQIGGWLQTLVAVLLLLSCVFNGVIYSVSLTYHANKKKEEDKIK